MRKFLFYLGILVFILGISSNEVYAYINPGSGSYLFQTIVSGFLAFLCFFKKIFKGRRECNDEENG